jgi:hypothetical protein
MFGTAFDPGSARSFGLFITVPGIYAIEMIFWFNQGQVTDALQTCATFLVHCCRAWQ